MPAALPPTSPDRPFPEPTHQRRAHPLAHLHNKEAPPAPPPWLAPARMVWHSDPTTIEDPERPADETFNGAWSRLFGESWPTPPEGEIIEVPDALQKFETADALYNLFPKGRIVIVYASSAMAICLTDLETEAVPHHVGELEAEATQVDAPQLEAMPDDTKPIKIAPPSGRGHKRRGSP